MVSPQASLLEKWSLFSERYQGMIPDFMDFLEALETPFPIGLRQNSLHPLPYSLEEKLRRLDVDFKKPLKSESFYHVPGERKFWGGDLDHHLGLYFMQALSSLLPSLALAPGSHEVVLDMCAAPGGKTSHLAQIMNNSGLLVASEPDLMRRRVLKANLSRMGVLNCSILAGKGQDLELKDESFDAILLDGPCSSEGTFRSDVLTGAKRRKTNYLEYNPKFRNSLHQEQKELLDKAYRLLKKGGRLVYSTCTYDPQENEMMVQYLLDKHQDLEVSALDLGDELKLQSGLVEYGGRRLSDQLKNSVRVYPHYVNSIGFYVAKILKH
jgi:NOL1/NOP2/sun family putative RNA methylase